MLLGRILRSPACSTSFPPVLPISHDILGPLGGLCAIASLVLTGCARAPADADLAAVETYRASLDTVTLALPEQEQWSGWRGGSLNGVSRSAVLPTVWSQQQNVRWRVIVPGSGNSSPIVWGDRLFVTSIVDTDSGNQAAVICINRRNGQLLWQQPVGSPQGTSHSKNGFASATPATDGARVYAAFGTLGLVVFDFEGKLLWQKPFPRQSHEWGTAASPLTVDRLVIHVVDAESDSAIVALDKYTGEEVWRTKRESRGSWSSPVLFNAGTTAMPQWQVVVNGTGSSAAGEVIAYDPANGRVIWKISGTSDIPCPTAIVGDSIIVSSSGGNGPIFAIRPESEPVGGVPQRLWRFNNGGAYVPTGVIHQQRLFLISDAGLATCLRLTDGGVIWRKRLQGAFSASLVAGGGNVYAVNERGDVYVYKAAEEFALIATNRLHEPCVATPALCNDEIFLRTQEHLYCIAVRNQLATESADIAPTVDPATIHSPADLDTSSPSKLPGVLSAP